MKRFLIPNNWKIHAIILSLFCFFSFTQDNVSKIEQANNDWANEQLYLNHPILTSDQDELAPDTVFAKNSKDLLKYLKSNRVIKLIGHEYHLNSTLLIDSIQNLEIVGMEHTILFIQGKNETTLEIANSKNIHLHRLIIGYTGIKSPMMQYSENQSYEGEHGALRICHSTGINISNCQILGTGTFGLTTLDVTNLSFMNSEITACSLLIFELESSENIEFRNSTFHDNQLKTSVLGGFTNATKGVTFLNCDFVDNKPAFAGNPAFNFMGNDKELNEKIRFDSCTFKNNVGFKWYGDKIELIDCKVDSVDFTNFQTGNQ